MKIFNNRFACKMGHLYSASHAPSDTFQKRIVTLGVKDNIERTKSNNLQSRIISGCDKVAHCTSLNSSSK